MDIHLDSKTEALIQQRLDEGQFPDAAEVVREAIEQMDARDRRLQELRAALQLGLDQNERGDSVEWTPRLASEIFERAKESSRKGKSPKNDVLP
jgi:antitoxin ParD1/3/4